MIFEFIQSDYYEELGKTNFAKDLREDNNDDLDWKLDPQQYYNTRVGSDGVIGVANSSGNGVGGCGNYQKVGDNRHSSIAIGDYCWRISDDHRTHTI